MITKTDRCISLELINEARKQLPEIDYKISLNSPTNDFFYDAWSIKEQFKNTVWEEILSTLPSDIGEARLISLKYGCNYQSHADIDDRYHLNIQAENSFLINLDKETMFKLVPDGYWYNMNTEFKHSAANFGSINRVQLVVRKLLKRNSLIDPKHVIIKCVNEELARYNFDNTVSPWLNKKNKKGSITNFVFNETIVEFDVESTEIDDLKNLIPSQFILDVK
jgi:hypothetical protein